MLLVFLGGWFPPFCFFGGECWGVLENLLLYLRERVFISCHLTRNEPKKQTKDGRTYGSPPWIHHSLVCARRTAEAVLQGRGKLVVRGALRPREGHVASAAECHTRENKLGERAEEKNSAYDWLTTRSLCLRATTRQGGGFEMGVVLLGLIFHWSAAFLSYKPTPSRPVGTSGRAATLGRGDPPFPQKGFATEPLRRGCDRSGRHGHKRAIGTRRWRVRASEGWVIPKRADRGSVLFGTFLWFVSWRVTRNEHSFS